MPLIHLLYRRDIPEILMLLKDRTDDPAERKKGFKNIWIKKEL